MGGYEMATLTSQLNYHHHSVISMQLWELGNKIDTDDISSIFRYCKWMQFPDGFAMLYLCLKAEVASLAVLSHKSQHVGPPIIL